MHTERIYGLFGEQRARRKPFIEEGNGMKAIARLGVAVAMTAALMLGFAGTASASAVFETEVHVRACGPDAVDLWEDCHGNPVEGYTVGGSYLDDTLQPVTCETGADGNCYFSVGGERPSYAYLYVEADVIAYYCSSESGNVTWAEDEPFWSYTSLDVDTLVVCDFYIYDENAGADAPALPDTGAGPMTQGANIGLLLAGVVALGGLAVASRRAAVR